MSAVGSWEVHELPFSGVKGGGWTSIKAPLVDTVLKKIGTDEKARSDMVPRAGEGG